jgi:hypothetical protein
MDRMHRQAAIYPLRPFFRCDKLLIGIAMHRHTFRCTKIFRIFKSNPSKKTYRTPRSGIPFGTRESITFLFDGRSFIGTFGIVDSNSFTVCKHLMTIDDAILPADFAARQRACFPFADKPF